MTRKYQTPLTMIKALGVRKTGDPMFKRLYTPKSTGKKTGFGICRFIAYLFEANELLPRSTKMTDEEIKRKLLTEFPGRPSVVKLGQVGKRGTVTINYHRNLYNK